MSTQLDRTALEAGAVITSLADVRAQVINDPDLPPRTRGEVLSALNSLARVLRLPLETIPAEPDRLRALIAGGNPAMADMSEGRWRNIRTLLQTALACAGLATMPRRFRHPPSAAWNALLEQLEYGPRYKLGHLARYCTAAGIEPDQLDATVLAGFQVDLRDHSLAAEPARRHRDAIIAWNRGVAALPDWPQIRLPVPDNRSHYALPWERFPHSLQADVERWLDRLAGTDPFEEVDFRPLRPASLRTRRKQLQEYLSALVHAGVPIDELRSLADAVTPDRAAMGLRFFRKRAGDKASVHGGHVAGLVCSIARHHTRAGEADLKKLTVMCNRITPRHHGMTERNRARLLPLEQPGRAAALLRLPESIRAEVVRAGKPTHRLAVLLQTAVAVEVLINTQMRMRNLRSLRIGVDLLHAADGAWDVAVRAADVKNGMPVERRLTGASARLIDLYVTRYRPLLPGAGSDWLFPGGDGTKPKSDDGLRSQLKGCLRQRCGLDFTPHTFRHAVAKIILDADPGAHGQVQILLGHKSINTTIAYYTGTETAAAFRRFDAQIAELRGDGGEAPRPQRGRSRRA